MDVLLLVLLGIIQGLTEFIPVSSSGHLVLFQRVFGMEYPGITLEIAVHGGTLLAVLGCYGKDALRVILALLAGLRDLLGRRVGSARVFRRADFHLGLTLAAATLATALVTLVLRDAAIASFGNLDVLAWTWLVTGILVWATRWRNPGGKFLSPAAAFLLGAAQAVAILPGISRSGITIFAALYLGLSRREAARFSFLLSIPAIAGALLWDLSAARQFTAEPGIAVGLMAAVMAAALSGYAALRIVIRKLERGTLYHFAPYVWILGATILAVRWIAG